MSYLQKENNRRILIVDDEADVLELLKTILEGLGWDVVAKSNSDEALAVLQELPCFLTITDIAMPDLDGYELIVRMKEQQALCQFALMTGFGYNPEHTLVKLNKTLKYPFLFKPFNRKKVEETAQKAFQAYHQDLNNT